MSISGLRFEPIVLPNEVKSFEDFSFSYYAAHPELYPANVATQTFGRGIYSFNTTTGVAYHDTTGLTSWGSSYTYLTPVLQFTSSDLSLAEANSYLLFNTHSDGAVLGPAHDKVLECLSAGKATSKQSLEVAPSSTSSSTSQNCAVCTGISPGLSQSAFPEEPISYLIQPIRPAYNQTATVGFVTAVLSFRDILQQNIAASVYERNLNIIVSSGSQYYSYEVEDGQLYFLGSGDLHDRKFNDQRRSIDLKSTLGGDVQFTTDAQTDFTIAFYPTQDYENSFRTSMPWVYCFTVTGIVVFLSGIFFIYDHIMLRNSNEQRAVLETKRRFVRFISHEVRTPLNAVVMASELLKEEVSRIIHGIMSCQFCIVSVSN